MDTEYGLEDGAKQLIYNELVNSEEGITKQDLVQYLKEISDANGLNCGKGQSLAQTSRSEFGGGFCLCVANICICARN